MSFTIISICNDDLRSSVFCPICQGFSCSSSSNYNKIATEQRWCASPTLLSSCKTKWLNQKNQQANILLSFRWHLPCSPSSIAVIAPSQSVLYPINFPSLFRLTIVFTAPTACKPRSPQTTKQKKSQLKCAHSVAKTRSMWLNVLSTWLPGTSCTNAWILDRKLSCIDAQTWELVCKCAHMNKNECRCAHKHICASNKCMWTQAANQALDIISATRYYARTIETEKEDTCEMTYWTIILELCEVKFTSLL